MHTYPKTIRITIDLLCRAIAKETSSLDPNVCAGVGKMISFNRRVTLVWLTSINRISILRSNSNNNNKSSRRTMQNDLRINDCRGYRFREAWDIPDEVIAKTRIMNSLESIQSPNAYQVQWTHKWKYDSVKESKSERKVCGKLRLYSNWVFFN